MSELRSHPVFAKIGTMKDAGGWPLGVCFNDDAALEFLSCAKDAGYVLVEKDKMERLRARLVSEQYKISLMADDYKEGIEEGKRQCVAILTGMLHGDVLEQAIEAIEKE